VGVWVGVCVGVCVGFRDGFWLVGDWLGVGLGDWVTVGVQVGWTAAPWVVFSSNLLLLLVTPNMYAAQICAG